MKSIIAVNEKVITHNTIKFSAGEVQLKVPDGLIQETNVIKAHICDSDGIMLLLQLASIIKQHTNTLVISYLPYSRYDRSEKPNDALSLKVFCDLINSMQFDKVITHDCHSDVGVALLDNSISIPQHILILDLFKSITQEDVEYSRISRYDAIVAPDAGASKKAFKLSQLLCKPLIECGKHRDFETGKILNFTVPSNQLLDENITDVLIVDDIADGGGTFIGLAQELLKYVDNVDLYVTHGIFSKGTDQLLEHITQVYAYHDWTTMGPDNFVDQFNFT